MCGVFGSIGLSKNPVVSYQLLTALFQKTEIRGTDATGFYACYPGNEAVIYDKEPLKSSEYVQHREVWASTFKDAPNVDLFIGHCRQTSVGGGPEKVNKNNHPHLSVDRRVAMVHNGKIPEFSALKNRYDVDSECDSEILLRMFESAQAIVKDKEKELKDEIPSLTPFLAERLLGLKEIFSRVNYGAMAVAIAERGDDGNRYLWLFRDDERPLHVVDMRPTLGQIFFCSTAEIWRNAIESTPAIKQYVPQDQVIIEFPSFQIWLLGLDPSKEDVETWNIRKFKVTKTKYVDWKQDDDEDDKLSFKKSKSTHPAPPMKVISRLDEHDEVVQPKEPSKESPPAQPPAKSEVGKKKVELDGGGNISLDGQAASAKVVVDRNPGDETEHVASEGDAGDRHGGFVANPSEIDRDYNQALKDEIIRNAEPIGTEGIDLDAFDNVMEQIQKDFERIKTEVHNRAREQSLSNRDFSHILDSLELIRNETAQTVNQLTAK